MSHRAFTVQEANDLLPRLREVLEEIQSTRRRARQHHEKLQVLDALWGDEVEDPENPDHEEFARRKQAIMDAEREVRAAIETEIVGRGVRFPVGGLEHGLLDFPTSYEGRWVYLCWRMGEEEVTHWHEVDAGYRGRRPITEEQAEVMGREDDPGDLDDSVLDF